MKKKQKVRSFRKEAEAAFPYLASDEKSSTFKTAEDLEFELNSSSDKPNSEMNTSSSSSSSSSPSITKKETKPWVHFVAGGVGGTVEQ